jgi:hypothetical protein
MAVGVTGAVVVAVSVAGCGRGHGWVQPLMLPWVWPWVNRRLGVTVDVAVGGAVRVGA